MSTEVFIGLVVVAVVDAIKSLAPQIKGALTVLLAGVVGGVLAAVDVSLGLPDVTVALGVGAGLAAAGGVGVVRRFGTSSDVTPVTNKEV